MRGKVQILKVMKKNKQHSDLKMSRIENPHRS